jgi:hypothetical protein
MCRNYLVSGPHVTGVLPIRSSASVRPSPDLTRWKRCNLWSAPTSQGVNVARGHRCALCHDPPWQSSRLLTVASRNGLAFILWLSLVWAVTPAEGTRNLYQKHSPLKMEKTVFPWNAAIFLPGHTALEHNIVILIALTTSNLAAARTICRPQHVFSGQGAM